MTAENIKRIAELKQLSSSIEEEYAGVKGTHAYRKNTIDLGDYLSNQWLIK